MNGTMAKQSSAVPRLTHEQRLASAGQFERANQVLKTGNFDYGMQLLLTCCLIDPGNPTYRQSLRQAQKAKYKNNMKGQNLAMVTTLRAKVKIKTAQNRGDYLKVLEFAEQVLMRNPWDVGTHLAMADAFENLDLSALAIWTLDQIRQVDSANPKINRPLARLFEKAGNFAAATALWEMVRKADPSDLEAQHKYKDLAASATIAKGRYEDAVQGAAPSPLVSGRGGANETIDEETDAESSDAEPPRSGQKVVGAAKVDAAKPGKSVPADQNKREDRAPREIAALKAKINSNPTNANAYLHLAAVYRRADQFDKARTVLDAGLKLTANNFEIGMELLDLEIEPFRRDLAVAEEKLRKQHDNEELQAIQAALVKEIATRELNLFRMKSDRFPTENAYRFEMGVRLLKCGQVDEAIRELQAIRSDPRHQGKASSTSAIVSRRAITGG